jgi:hypothetical protein
MSQKLVYDENNPIEVVMEDLASLKRYKDYIEYFKDADIATIKDLLNDIQSASVALFNDSISINNARYQIMILKDLIAERVNAIASDEGTTIIDDIYHGIIIYIACILLYNDKGATADIENPVKVNLRTAHKIENYLGYKQAKLIKYEKPIVGRHYTDPYLTLRFRYQDITITLCLIDYDTAGDYTIVLAYNINGTEWSKVSVQFEFDKSGGYRFELFIAALLGVEDEVLFSKQMLTLNFLD